MKTLATIVLFIGVFGIVKAQMPIADAGNDTLICLTNNTIDSIIIGGNPTASDGQPPYTYRWYFKDNSEIGSIDWFISDSTIANPAIYPTYIIPHDQIIFLDVTDSTGAVATDSLLFGVCGYTPHPLGYSVISPEVGDTVVLYARQYYTCNVDSIEWFPKDHIISSPNADSVQVVISDTSFNYNSYYIELYNSNDCFAQGMFEPKIYEIYPQSIAEYTSVATTLYPNPTMDGKVTVESKSVIQEVSIFNMQGRLVIAHQDKSNRVDIETNLSPGIYYIRLSTDEGETVEKLIIQ